MSQTVIERVWNTIAILVVGGFFVFGAVIGGSAGNGYMEAGKYFVGDHGNYTEVSATVWQISEIWGAAFWLTIFLNIPIHFLIDWLEKRSHADK